jgi:hypothetical protein
LLIVDWGLPPNQHAEISILKPQSTKSRNHQAAIRNLKGASNPPKHRNSALSALWIVAPSDARCKRERNSKSDYGIDRQFSARGNAHVVPVKRAVPRVCGIGENCRMNGAQKQWNGPGPTLDAVERKPVVQIGNCNATTDDRIGLESSKQTDGASAKIKRR